MTRSTFTIVAAAAFLAGGLVGCQQPKMDLEKMMTPPARPPELDQLNPFVGTWEGTWEMKTKGTDKPVTGKGTDVFAWDADRWVMVERADGTMNGHRMVGTGLWVWDPQAKLFCYTSSDNYGMIMTGTCRYDAKTGIWHMKGRTRDTVRGEQSVGEGTLKMVDANTMEWNFAGWDSLHLVRYMEFSGTSRRK